MPSQDTIEEQLTFLVDDDDDDSPEIYPAAFLTRPSNSPKLVEVKIEALKGIDSLTVELRPFTVLTGPNNSGKSTILQAIALGFECFRRCVDSSTWSLREAGRAIHEFDFLPVNEPRDLWYHRKSYSGANRRPVRVGMTFDNKFDCTFNIRSLYGFLNIKVAKSTPEPGEELLKTLASITPIFLPATSGPVAHETQLGLAQIHRMVVGREHPYLVRNILLRLQEEKENESHLFVAEVIKKYFDVELKIIDFNPTTDLEIRAPYHELDYELDIVSAGSGMNQILQIAAFIAWLKPGIVLLDEPDAHLHTSLQSKLLNFLWDMATQFELQIILATHSRDLISQAPLESIVPVDLSRKRLAPLASMEHLLLEYERQGSISNVDLALLYQTKRCLFVEGASDSKLITQLADRLGLDCFQGPNQFVTFEFGGVDNLKLIPNLVALFKKMVGGDLCWAVVRDRDANLPRIIEEYKKQGESLGIPYFHIWSRYSIENYLMEPPLILDVIKKKKPVKDVDIASIENALSEAIGKIEPEIRGPFITKAQTAYRDFEIAGNPFDVGAAEATNFLVELGQDRDAKLRCYPGKKLFGQLVQLFQERWGVNLRLEELVSVVTRDKIDKEVVDFLKGLCNLKDTSTASHTDD